MRFGNAEMLRWGADRATRTMEDGARMNLACTPALLTMVTAPNGSTPGQLKEVRVWASLRHDGPGVSRMLRLVECQADDGTQCFVCVEARQDADGVDLVWACTFDGEHAFSAALVWLAETSRLEGEQFRHLEDYTLLPGVSSALASESAPGCRWLLDRVDNFFAERSVRRREALVQGLPNAL